MHVSNLTNHYLYWVDRFDHVLSIEECQDVSFMSFTDLEKRESDQALVSEYLQAEDTLIRFIFEVVAHHDAPLHQSFVRYSWFSAGAETSEHLYSTTQLTIIQDLDKLDKGAEDCLKLESKEQLRDFLQLGIRELLKVKLKVGEVYVETGFDMGLLMQNILEDELLKIAAQTGVHVLRRWEHSMWE
jgi:hypothetical protein